MARYFVALFALLFSMTGIVLASTSS